MGASSGIGSARMSRGEGEGEGEGVPGDQTTPERDGYTRLYHGGTLTEITDSGLFGGIFASDSETSAASHGDLNYLDVPTDAIAENRDLDGQEAERIIREELRDDVTEDEFNVIYSAIINDTGLWDLEIDQDRIQSLFRETEMADADWKAQTIRGKIARELGYKAVEMADEHGASYLVLPGVPVAKMGEALPGSEPRMSASSGIGSTRFSKAYHGTRHRFDKFSLEAMGSGEGAQAFGWGLYFAGNRQVAEFYKSALQESQLKIDGEAIPNISGGHVDTSALAKVIQEKTNAPEREANSHAIIIANAKSKAEARRLLSNRAQEYRDEGFQDAAEATRKLQTYLLRIKEIDGEGTGNIYEVEIPDDTDLLDRDAQLIDQPAKVKEALAKTGFITNNGNGFRWIGNATGAQVYDILAATAFANQIEDNSVSTIKEIYEQESGDDRAASELLSDLGIPGLRYLDGLSQEKGQGTHNYVIWSEDMVTVDAVNNEAVQAQIMFSRAPTPGTSAFKKWFGGSKLVYKDGTPKRLYHGTDADISSFRPGVDTNGLIFFTESPDVANEYATGAHSYGRINESFIEFQVAMDEIPGVFDLATGRVDRRAEPDDIFDFANSVIYDSKFLESNPSVSDMIERIESTSLRRKSEQTSLLFM